MLRTADTIFLAVGILFLLLGVRFFLLMYFPSLRRSRILSKLNIEELIDSVRESEPGHYQGSFRGQKVELMLGFSKSLYNYNFVRIMILPEVEAGVDADDPEVPVDYKYVDIEFGSKVPSGGDIKHAINTLDSWSGVGKMS